MLDNLQTVNSTIANDQRYGAESMIADEAAETETDKAKSGSTTTKQNSGKKVQVIRRMN